MTYQAAGGARLAEALASGTRTAHRTVASVHNLSAKGSQPVQAGGGGPSSRVCQSLLNAGGAGNWSAQRLWNWCPIGTSTVESGIKIDGTALPSDWSGRAAIAKAIVITLQVSPKEPAKGVQRENRLNMAIALAL